MNQPKIFLILNLLILVFNFSMAQKKEEYFMKRYKEFNADIGFNGGNNNTSVVPGTSFLWGKLIIIKMDFYWIMR